MSLRPDQFGKISIGLLIHWLVSKCSVKGYSPNGCEACVDPQERKHFH